MKNNREKETVHESSENLNRVFNEYRRAKKEIPQLGWGGIIGQKDFLRGAADAFRAPFEIFRGGYDMFKAAIAPRNIIRLPTDSIDGKERFRIALEFYKLSEDDITQRINASALIFYTAFVAILLDIGIFLFFSFRSPHGFMNMSLFWALLLFLLLFPKCLQYGLLNYQMRTRSLSPVGEYLKKSDNWLPVFRGRKKDSDGDSGSGGNSSGSRAESGSGKKIRNQIVGLFLVGAPLLLYGSSAFATDGTGAESSLNEPCQQAVQAVTIENILSIPCNRDLFLQSLARMFPGIGPLADVPTTVAQSYGSGFVSALAVFVTIINTVAIASMSYQSCMSVVNTAMDGEALGKKWHKVWSPVRIVYGFGMLAPVKGGVCMAQIFVLYIALWSGNWASMIYMGYLTGIQKPPAITSFETPETPNTFGSLVRLNLCRSLQSRINGTDLWVPWEQSQAHKPSTNPTRNMIVNGSITQEPVPNQNAGMEHWDFENCGSLYAKQSAKAGGNILSSLISSTGNSLKSLITSSNSEEQRFIDASQKLYGDRITAISTLNDKIHEVTDKIIDEMFRVRGRSEILSGKNGEKILYDKYFSINGELDEALHSYNDDVIASSYDFMKGLQSSTQDDTHKYFTSTVENNGWMVAGAYYMTTTRMTSAIQSAIGESPRMSVSSIGTDELERVVTQSLNEEGHGYMENFKSALGNFVDSQSSGLSPVDESVAVGGAKFDSKTGVVKNYSAAGVQQAFLQGGFIPAWDYIVNGLNYVIATRVVDMLGVVPGNGAAFQQMINFGHDILDFCWILILLALVMNYGGKVISIVSKAGSLVEGIASFFTGQAEGVADSAKNFLLSDLIGGFTSKIVTFLVFLAGILFTIGVIYAYIFPMLPYINFLFFEQGTLMLVAECVIAAPILAYLHVRFDGEEMVTQVQTTGYKILFNLFLRMPLGIFGLILSLAMFEVTIWLNSILWKMAFNGAIADNASDPTASIVFVIITMYIEWQLAVKSFSLISTLPQKISVWFGANAEEHGERDSMNTFLAFGMGPGINTLGNMVSGKIRGVGNTTSAGTGANGNKAGGATGERNTPSSRGGGSGGKGGRKK